MISKLNPDKNPPVPMPDIRVLKFEHALPPGDTGKLRVAAYCRVSTCMDIQKSSLDGQERYYTYKILSNPRWILAGIYCERGVSATGKERQPELERLLADCRDGRIDMVLTKSISRLARNVEGCLTIIRELVSLGVAFRFEKEHIDSESMQTELLLTILAAFAEAESKSISANVRWGIRKQFRDGTYRISRPPFGYRMENGTAVIVREEAAIVQRIFMQTLSGSGTGTIASQLNEENIPSALGGHWRKGSILSTLRNPFYCGDALFQKTYTDEHFRQRKNKGEKDQYLIEDHHASIIPREVFRLAGEMIRQHGKDLGNTGTNRNRYALSGKLICAHCRSKLARSSGPKYRCSKRAEHLCSLPDIYEEDVLSSFTTAMNKLSFLESELSPLAHALSLLRRGTLKYKDIDELRTFLNGRGIRSSFSEKDEAALATYVLNITVYSRCRFEFHMKCGLILNEAFTPKMQPAGIRHGKPAGDPRRERRQDGTHSVRVPH